MSVEIKRLKIDYYGPLQDIDIELEPGFNGFYGRNESGKTLMVEALAKMLVDDSSGFSKIGRVEQEPKGLLTIEKDGEEFEASQEELETIFGDVKAEDVQNAFIIRDLDLRLPERNNSFGKSDYYRDVTDRILGSRTQKIEGLRGEISDHGHLTNDTSDSKLDNVKGTKLRDRRKDAEKLHKDIEKFLSRTEEEGIYRKFSEIDSMRRKIERKKKEIEQLEDARDQKRYEEGLKLVNKIEDTEEKLEEIEEEKKGLEELKELKMEAEKFEREESDHTWRYASLGSGALSGLSLLTALFNPYMIFIGAAVLFLITAAYSFKQYRNNRVELSRNRSEEERILREVNAKGLEADTLEEAVGEIDELDDKIGSREEKLKADKGDAVGQLKGKFGQDIERPDEWREYMDDFSERFESNDIEFEDGSLEDAEEELEGLKGKISERENELEDIRDRVAEFSDRFSRTVREEFLEQEKIDLKAFEDLQDALKQLEEFQDSLDKMVSSSRTAVEILEEMERDEGDEFNKLFEDPSYAVKMFRKATDEKYTDINYEKASQELKVKKGEETLNPENLSQGTYDLLYMSIRLGLAREILDEPGFLVMDNAFAHSDVERVEKEVEFLSEMEEEGWQIIYLTYRDDVREILADKAVVQELDRL